MDIDNLQQNMNTRVVFKEPRGMIRWLQLFFAIVAFSTVADFHTSIGIDITCPPQPTSSNNLNTATNATGLEPVVSPTSLQQENNTVIHPKLVVKYPFDFSSQTVNNTCPNNSHSFKYIPSLTHSPQFFVTTGVFAFLYAVVCLVVYLLLSSTYESVPGYPVADLIVTGILCLFWLIASCSFSSGLAQLKNFVTYENIEQTLCSNEFTMGGGSCSPSPTEVASWSSLTIGVICGFTSFILWGSGMWFVYKETHFHVPRDQLGPR